MTNPYLGFYRMGSGVLDQFDNVVLDGVDVGIGQVPVEASPCHRHAERHCELKRPCRLKHAQPQQLGLPWKSLHPQRACEIAERINATVVADRIDLREPRLVRVDLERALEMRSRFRKPAEMMQRVAQHPFRQGGRTWIRQLL